MLLRDQDNAIRLAVAAAFNLNLRGEPAIGKTMSAMKTLNALKAEGAIDNIYHLNGATLAATDIVMAMPDPDNKTLNYFYNAMLPNAHVNPDERSVIYVGEKGLIEKLSGKFLQKLINHEECGGYRTPDGTIFLFDGNLLTDNSNVQIQGRAIESRMSHITVEFDLVSSQEYAKSNFHPIVGSFIAADENIPWVNNYREVYKPERKQDDQLAVEGKSGIWASMRSWERVSNMYFAMDKTHSLHIHDELIYGTVGVGAGNAFRQHETMVSRLATFEQIKADPKRAPVPGDMSECFTLVLILSHKTGPATLTPVVTYVSRFPVDQQIIWGRMLLDRVNKDTVAKSAVIANPAFRAWFSSPNIQAGIKGSSAVI
jgi:hypothetical protein